jgi:hypothetical protein
MDATNAIFYIIILVMSIVIHEVSHGFMAEYFGDPTARNAGRLTLNPIPHLDIFGSILLPAILVLSHSPFLFGWAKPVPYNPNNLSNKKWGTISVAVAGVAMNFFIAIVFGLIIRFSADFVLPPGFYFITSVIVIVNLDLATRKSFFFYSCLRTIFSDFITCLHCFLFRLFISDLGFSISSYYRFGIIGLQFSRVYIILSYESADSFILQKTYLYANNQPINQEKQNQSSLQTQDSGLGTRIQCPKK